MAEKTVIKVLISAEAFEEFEKKKSDMSLLPFNPPEAGFKVNITPEMIEAASGSQISSLLYHGPIVSDWYECTKTKDKAEKRTFPAKLRPGEKQPKPGKERMITVQHAEWKSVGDNVYDIGSKPKVAKGADGTAVLKDPNE